MAAEVEVRKPLQDNLVKVVAAAIEKVNLPSAVATSLKVEPEITASAAFAAPATKTLALPD